MHGASLLLQSLGASRGTLQPSWKNIAARLDWVGRQRRLLLAEPVPQVTHTRSRFIALNIIWSAGIRHKLLLAPTIRWNAFGKMY